MKVIFKNTSEVKDVPDGYARNYLIPKGLAVSATEAELKKIKDAEKRKAEESEKKTEEMVLTAKKINGKLITVSKKAGRGGKLFGSVTGREISEAVNSQLGIRIDKHNIRLTEPVKKAGRYEVEIDLGKGSKAIIILEVL